MNEQIKKLRKTLGLTLEKFGEQLGVGKSAISKLEKGERNVTEQMFKSICRISWNGRLVNENWLRTGEGDMFLELLPEDEIGICVSELIENKDNPFYHIILETVHTYTQLTPDNQEVLTFYCKQLLDNLKKKEKD